VLFMILFAILITISSLSYGYIFGSIIIILSIVIVSLLYFSLQQILQDNLKK
jgi:Ca2+/Na+ antiporter